VLAGDRQRPRALRQRRDERSHPRALLVATDETRPAVGRRSGSAMTPSVRGRP
jgi:hypothetical protein